MTKIVGAAEFKAKCLALIDAMQRDGEPITITKRGKPVATLSPAAQETKAARKPSFGFMKDTVTWAPDFDPSEPADPDWLETWEANNPPELYRR